MDTSKKICLAKLSASIKYKVDAKAKDRHGRTALQEAERCNHKRLDIKQNRMIIFQIFPQPTNQWQNRFGCILGPFCCNMMFIRIIDIFHKWESLENASTSKEELTR